MESIATSITQIHTSNVSELSKLKQLMNKVVDHLDRPVVNKAALEDIRSLPNIVYYNDDHSKSPVCTGELSAINRAVWTLPGTWQELTREIERGEDKIVFHIDMINKSGESIKDFTKSLKTIVKFMPGHKPLKILVLITPTTTQQQIKELKASSILGIGYDTTYYSFEQAAEATTALLAGEPYWPEDIISQLPKKVESNLPRVVSFWAKPVQYLSSELRQQVLDKKLYRVGFCDTWDGFAEAVSEPCELILFHCKMRTTQNLSAEEVISMISSLTQYTAGHLPKIGAVVDRDTSIETLIELRKTSVCGIVPNSTYWGVDVGTSAVMALLNTGSHWPVHLLCDTPQQIDQVMSAKPPVALVKVPLTPRQQEIADLIKGRGISNKHIARQLNISESAVKLHVGAILKKHNLRNRTQLAVALARGLTA